MSPCSDKFYWTDRRLRTLVNTYYMYLEDLNRGQGTIEKNGKTCLADLKRKLRWKITIPMLKSRLEKFFSDYADKRNDYLAFRIRIGKDMRFLFDRLVEFDNYDLYAKKVTTSSRSRGTSSGLSSSSRSFRMSQTDRRKVQSMAQMDEVTLELAKLGLNLNEDQLATAILKLTKTDNIKVKSHLKSVKSTEELYDLVLKWAELHYPQLKARRGVLETRLRHLIRFPLA